MKKGEIYTKNEYDFIIHDVIGEYVFGCLYYAKDRGRLDDPNTKFGLFKKTVDEFRAEAAELVTEETK